VEEIISLLAAGAEVDTHDVAGNTSLIFASQFGFLGIVEKLIRSEAKLDLCNKEGQNALMMG
jgi:ankyrin repeat protein